MSSMSSGRTASARSRNASGETESPRAEEGREGFGPGVLAAEQDDALEIRQVLIGEHADVVRVEEARHGEQPTSPALLQLVRGLGPLVAGAQRHEDRAHALQPDRRDHPLGHVGCPDRDPIAVGAARRDQRAPDPLGSGAQLPVGVPGVVVLDRSVIAEGGHGRRDHPRQRAFLAGFGHVGSRSWRATRAPSWQRPKGLITIRSVSEFRAPRGP